MDFPTTSIDLFLLINIFDNNTLSNEKQNNFIDFLIELNLVDETSCCPNEKCPDKFKNHLIFHNKQLKYRCRNKICHQKEWSISNTIFTYDQTTNLSIMKIIQLLWYWSNPLKASIKFISNELKLTCQVVSNWFEKFRDYTVLAELLAPLMGGPGYVVEVDESMWRAKRKANKGRLMTGGKKKSNTVRDKLEAICAESIAEPLPNDNSKHRNYGDQVRGPWVLGMICREQQIIDINKEIKYAMWYPLTLLRNQTKLFKMILYSSLGPSNLACYLALTLVGITFYYLL
jgi:hypothetical protein